MKTAATTPQVEEITVRREGWVKRTGAVAWLSLAVAVLSVCFTWWNAANADRVASRAHSVEMRDYVASASYEVTLEMQRAYMIHQLLAAVDRDDYPCGQTEGGDLVELGHEFDEAGVVAASTVVQAEQMMSSETVRDAQLALGYSRQDAHEATAAAWGSWVYGGCRDFAVLQSSASEAWKEVLQIAEDAIDASVDEYGY